MSFSMIASLITEEQRYCIWYYFIVKKIEMNISPYIQLAMFKYYSKSIMLLCYMRLGPETTNKQSQWLEFHAWRRS